MRQILFRGKRTDNGKWVYGNLLQEICNTFISATRDAHFEVITETVGQLTGLKDKNNNDIYEGDICWTYEIGIGILLRVVVFDNGSFCVTHPFCITNELRGWKQDYIEIIGNIHEHKHLLETSLA